jgi:hypothetical protein
MLNIEEERGQQEDRCEMIMINKLIFFCFLHQIVTSLGPRRVINSPKSWPISFRYIILMDLQVNRLQQIKVISPNNANCGTAITQKK